MLKDRHIVLGVTGGIAAYKAPLIVRALKAQGAQVRVVMTEAAKAFVTPLTLQTLSENPVHEALFDPTQEYTMGHIELARWADAVLIAPATAQILAKLTHGLADDLLSTLVLATEAPIMLAPAMNKIMWANPATQSNVDSLTKRGFHLLPVGSGAQACGEIGPGRMLEPEEILEHVNTLFGPSILQGKRVLITAGPTQEALDPVRYLSNRSSGKMGFALAEAARSLGAEVTLVCGPTTIAPPQGLLCIPVKSAQAMLDAVMTHVHHQDIFVAAAAVADYRPAQYAQTKIKKGAPTLTLDLVKNPDILAQVAQLPTRPLCIGFAAETHNPLEHARAKLIQKNCDMICLNDVSQKDIGFDSDDNALTLITADRTLHLDKQSKTHLAQTLWQHIAELPESETTHA